MTDHTFWWAHSNASASTPYTVNFLSDGLHIGGNHTHNDGNLIFRNITMTAAFELQSERIPPSANGVWESRPFVAIYGGVIGHIPRGHFWPELPFVLEWDDDFWAKCWLNLRQTIFQYQFGQTGPVKKIQAAASSSMNLVFIENNPNDNIFAPSDPVTRFFAMPGLLPMPPVVLTEIYANSLWVELSIQIDIQLEGDGSSIRMDPEVVLRTFQWPLRAL